MVIHVHRDKLFGALDTLADDGTAGEVVRKTGLSYGLTLKEA